MPSMFGIITSSNTASGASDERSAKPSAPPDASMISWPSQARFIPQSLPDIRIVIHHQHAHIGRFPSSSSS